MKSTNSSILSLIASRNYYRAELFAITPLNGSPAYWTSYDYPLTVGAITYNTGLVIKRGAISSERGITTPTLEVTVTPKPDAATSNSINGVGLLQAIRRGTLRGAAFTLSRVFMPTALDTSLGAVLTVAAYTEMLNVQMPRNLISAGCVHTLYDAGCALVKGAAGTSATGTVTGTPSTTGFTCTGPTNADGFYNLGTVKFAGNVTPALAGVERTVKTYTLSGGTFALMGPLPVKPAAGDTFTAYAGCDKTQSTCSSKFSNLARYRGFPYVPVPETLYDGGTYNPPAPVHGSQGGIMAGSLASAGYGRPYSA